MFHFALAFTYSFWYFRLDSKLTENGIVYEHKPQKYSIQ